MPLTVTFRGLNPQQMKAAVLKAQKQLLVIAGQESVNFFKRRFAEGGWIDGGFEAWQKRKNDKRKGGALMVQTGKLRNSIHVKQRGADYLIIGTDMPYARIHNEGYDGNEQVKAHSRKTFKQLMVKATSLKSRKTSSRSVRIHTGTGEVKAFTRHMKMPQREYIGQSSLLNRRVEMIFKYELDKIK